MRILTLENCTTQLARIRITNGFSRQELSDASGVSVRMIEKYEVGEKDINKAQSITIYQLATALNCQMSDLLELDK